MVNAILGRQESRLRLLRSNEILWGKDKGRPGTEVVEAAWISMNRDRRGVKLTTHIWRLRYVIDDPNAPAAAWSAAWAEFLHQRDSTEFPATGVMKPLETVDLLLREKPSWACVFWSAVVSSISRSSPHPPVSSFSNDATGADGVSTYDIDSLCDYSLIYGIVFPGCVNRPKYD